MDRVNTFSWRRIQKMHTLIKIHSWWLHQPQVAYICCRTSYQDNSPGGQFPRRTTPPEDDSPQDVSPGNIWRLPCRTTPLQDDSPGGWLPRRTTLPEVIIIIIIIIIMIIQDIYPAGSRPPGELSSGGVIFVLEVKNWRTYVCPTWLSRFALDCCALAFSALLNSLTIASTGMGLLASHSALYIRVKSWRRLLSI